MHLSRLGHPGGLSARKGKSRFLANYRDGRLSGGIATSAPRLPQRDRSARIRPVSEWRVIRAQSPSTSSGRRTIQMALVHDGIGANIKSRISIVNGKKTSTANPVT